MKFAFCASLILQLKILVGSCQLTYLMFYKYYDSLVAAGESISFIMMTWTGDEIEMIHQKDKKK